LKSPCTDTGRSPGPRLLAQPEVKPIGLGARNSLRLEAGLCLYGNDIDTTTTPVEAGLNWAMQKVRRTGGARAGGFPVPTRCWLLQLDGTEPLKRYAQTRGPGGAGAHSRARAHRAADPAGERMGEVTSGLLGPTIDQPVAMGYVDPIAALGTRLNAMVRGKPVPMEVVPCRLCPHRYYRG
jgi:aminomethyltransferase